MSKKKKNNEPPSLFDSLDLFADTGATDTGTTGVSRIISMRLADIGVKKQEG